MAHQEECSKAVKVKEEREAHYAFHLLKMYILQCRILFICIYYLGGARLLRLRAFLYVLYILEVLTFCVSVHFCMCYTCNSLEWKYILDLLALCVSVHSLYVLYM